MCVLPSSLVKQWVGSGFLEQGQCPMASLRRYPWSMMESQEQDMETVEEGNKV